MQICLFIKLRSVPIWHKIEVCPCLVHVWSPGGCAIVQGLCDAACRGLSRQAERLSPKDRADRRAGKGDWVCDGSLIFLHQTGIKRGQTSSTLPHKTGTDLPFIKRGQTSPSSIIVFFTKNCYNFVLLLCEVIKWADFLVLLQKATVI